jgi:hypothetical protein
MAFSDVSRAVTVVVGGANGIVLVPVRAVDTPPDKSGGFSVHRGSYRHRSLTGLPGPLNISGRIFVAV